MSLTGVAISSAKWNYVTGALGLVVQVGYTVVSTHLIGPEDFAAFAIVMTGVNVVSFLGITGLGNAVLRSAAGDDARLRAAVRLCAAIGFIFLVLGELLAPLAPQIWPLPGIEIQVRVLAFLPLLCGLAAIGIAGYRREGQYRLAAGLELMGLVCGFAFGTALLIAGVGPVALSLAQVFGVTCVVVACAVGRPRLASGQARKSDIAPVASFAFQIGWMGMFQYAMNNLPLWVSGRIYGASETGLYARAFSLVGIPLTQLSQGLTRAVYPLYGTVARDRERLSRAVADVVSATSFAAFLLAAIGASLAEPTVQILLGPAWQGAAAYVVILCMSESIDMVSSQVGVVAESLRMLNILWISLASTAVALAILLGIVKGFGVGLTALLVGMIGVRAVTLVVRIAMSSARLEVSRSAVLLALLVHASIGVSIYALTYGLGAIVNAGAVLQLTLQVPFIAVLLLALWKFGRRIPGVAILRQRISLAKAAG
jgi:O-antigen/teichoic acid export membrane protein